MRPEDGKRYVKEKLSALSGKAYRQLENIKNIYAEFEKPPEVWSGLDLIELKSAPDTVIPGCIVLEGGSFRGVYTSGALDVLMENGINMQTAIGTSAGALNGVNYISGQIGRSGRINLGYRHDRRYFGLKSAVESHGVIGLDFIINGIDDELPFDRERFDRPDRRYVATATDCRTGAAMYWEKGICGDITKAVQASASIPFLSAMVDVDGVPCLDGGCAVKIPYKWALEQGFEKIIVVRTRSLKYRRPPETDALKSMAQQVYRHYPALIDRLCSQAEQYNAACDELERLHREGRVFMLNPDWPIHIRTIEGDMERLGDLYMRGRRDTQEKLPALREYLEK